MNFAPPEQKEGWCTAPGCNYSGFYSESCGQVMACRRCLGVLVFDPWLWCQYAKGKPIPAELERMGVAEFADA